MDGPDPFDDVRHALAQPADPVVAGLERKLDVLRAQLAACQAGQDVGAAGLEAWSRLEQQTHRIAALEAYIAQQAALALPAGWSTATGGAPCAKAPAALDSAAGPPGAPEREMLRAMLASTSWRLTRPLRLLGNRLKGRRDQSL